MFEGLDSGYIPGAVEAMLFVTDEPVNVLTLAEMLECEASLVEQALLSIKEKLEKDESGIQLREVAGGWRLFTHPMYHELIEKYVLSWDTRKLSQAAIETLAIIAYTQPVTRTSVASIRGVSSDSSISSLLEKGLIREAGVADSPGNPTLYATTRTFLEKFGLRSVKDLTDISEFAPDEETRRLISDRLSASRQTVGITDDEARIMAEDMLYSDGAIQDAVRGEDFLSASQPSVQNDVRFEDTASDAEATEEMFRRALASTLGVVEKIDFDEIEFDLGDE